MTRWDGARAEVAGWEPNGNYKIGWTPAPRLVSCFATAKHLQELSILLASVSANHRFLLAALLPFRRLVV
jgi:hypothetical protein